MSQEFPVVCKSLNANIFLFHSVSVDMFIVPSVLKTTGTNKEAPPALLTTNVIGLLCSVLIVIPVVRPPF